MLDFIYFFIKNLSKKLDEDQLHDKSLRDYIEAHLQSKDGVQAEDLIKNIHPDFKNKHAIALFDFVVKKLRERV